MLTTDVFIQMMNYSIVSCTSIEANLKVLDFCPNILLDGWYIKYDQIENKKTGAGSTLFALFGPEYLSLVPEISRLLPNEGSEPFRIILYMEPKDQKYFSDLEWIFNSSLKFDIP